MQLAPLIPGDAHNWPYIALIKSFFPRPSLGGYSIATGTLIAPRVVVTAGHAVFDPDEGGRTDHVEMTFGGPGGMTVISSEVDYTAQWRDQDSYSATSSLSAFDCGIVVLSQAIDRFVVPVPFDTLSDSMVAGLTLSVAGYPIDPPETRGTLYGARFQALQGSTLPADAQQCESFRFFYPVQTVEGVSGGPVYSYDAASNIRTLRGIHTSFPPWIGLGSALRISENIYSLLQDWVAAHRP